MYDDRHVNGYVRIINIGIKNSSSEYIAMSADRFIAPTSWFNLFLLENNNKYFPFSNEYMLIPRKQFPQADYENISYNQLDKICKYNLFGQFNQLNNKAHAGGGAGGLLLSKIYSDLKGFDASVRGFGGADLSSWIGYLNIMII